MDPRHPQHPFSRNTASPYSHAPFQSGASQAPFPAASHPQNAPPSYPEQQHHQRRTSENSFYGPSSSSYSRDGAPMPTSGHARHTSASSIGHGTPLIRNMPPPSSPQQGQQQVPQSQSQSHTYAPPSISRNPAPSVGPSMAFTASRDLPSLSSINRPGSVNSSMSISSMLGGPPAASRDPVAHTSQYPAPPSAMAASTHPSTYGNPNHGSPRSANSGPDYGRFRRPQTPEQQRIHDAQIMHDHRAQSAGSPPGVTSISTPEGRRYGTPQTYSQRNGPAQQLPIADERREGYPVRVNNPNVMPPRPSSQPALFNAPPSRIHEGSRVDNGRPEAAYVRAIGYAEREREEHQAIIRERERERARMEEEAAIRRERERMELRDSSGYGSERRHDGPPTYGRQYTPQTSGPYNGPPETRDPTPWMRGRPDQPPIEQPPPHSQPPTSYDFYRSQVQTAGPTHTAYNSQDSRYSSGSYGPARPSPQAATVGPQFGSPTQDRQRMTSSQPPQQQIYGPGPGSYRPQGSPRSHSNEDPQQIQRGGLLGVQQEINQKGRRSPFPQAVQGAQGQLSGPGGEPGIKSEFGKMFSGIGAGAGIMSTGSAASGGAQTPYSSSGQLRRDDLDSVSAQDLVGENGNKIARSSSRGGESSRRRKLKDDDSREGDDRSLGRRTPIGRGSKRPKGLQQQQNNPIHQSANSQTSRPEIGGPASSPVQMTMTPLKGGNAHVDPSPPSVENKIIPHHHHIIRVAHHHHKHQSPNHTHQNIPKPIPVPKPNRVVKSQAVLDSVLDRPRKHLGHFDYTVKLKAGEPPSLDHGHKARPGFTGMSNPLPRYEGNENCTLTVRVPRVNLTHTSRQEITSRRQLWGTEIYTDDSDVVAACIHGGWFRGAWPDDVDVSALDLVVDVTEKNGKAHNGKSKDKDENHPKEANGVVSLRESQKSGKDTTLTKPPPTGPLDPPQDRDLQVTLLLLPALNQYASTTRWGIKSHEWSKTHDGISFMIMRIKWTSGVDSVKEARGADRRMRMNLALAQEEIEEERSWVPYFLGSDEIDSDRMMTDEFTRESFVRGEPGPSNGISGLGMGGWWLARQPPKNRAVEQAEEVVDGHKAKQIHEVEGADQAAIIDADTEKMEIDPDTTLENGDTEETNAETELEPKASVEGNKVDEQNKSEEETGQSDTIVHKSIFG